MTNSINIIIIKWTKQSNYSSFLDYNQTNKLYIIYSYSIFQIFGSVFNIIIQQYIKDYHILFFIIFQYFNVQIIIVILLFLLF